MSDEHPGPFIQELNLPDWYMFSCEPLFKQPTQSSSQQRWHTIINAIWRLQVHGITDVSLSIYNNIGLEKYPQFRVQMVLRVEL